MLSLTTFWGSSSSGASPALNDQECRPGSVSTVHQVAQHRDLRPSLIGNPGSTVHQDSVVDLWPSQLSRFGYLRRKQKQQKFLCNTEIRNCGSISATSSSPALRSQSLQRLEPTQLGSRGNWVELAADASAAWNEHSTLTESDEEHKRAMISGSFAGDVM